MRRLATAMWVLVCALAPLGRITPVAGAQCPVATFPYKHGIVVFVEHGETTRVRVEIADTRAAQEYGLMCRTSLAADAGMLFRFPEDTDAPFWMKNTLIPLSIAFIDKSWHIVALKDMPVAADPASDRLPTYGPNSSYRYALEVNQGFFAQHAIDAAAQASFSATDP